MLLNSDKKNDIDFKKDWPKHYYEISDIHLREKILRDVILELSGEASSNLTQSKTTYYCDKQNADTNVFAVDGTVDSTLADEQRRLEILLKRYPSNTPPLRRIDKFTAAWMDLLIDTRLGINFINKNRVKKDVLRCLKDLLIIDFSVDDILINEWTQFAEFWISSCVKDSTYDSTAFGLLRLSDKRLGNKIASEIIDVTYTLPAKFGFEVECTQIRNVFKSTFLRLVDNGSIYWSEAMNK